MIIRRCVTESEQGKILNECHASPYGGHFSGERTAHRILKSGFYWPTLFRDCAEWVKLCDRCQKIGNISSNFEVIFGYFAGFSMPWPLSLSSISRYVLNHED